MDQNTTVHPSKLNTTVHPRMMNRNTQSPTATYSPTSVHPAARRLQQQQQQQQPHHHQQPPHHVTQQEQAVLQNQDHEVPRRHIFAQSDMTAFKTSPAFQSLDVFLRQLAHLITNTKLTTIEQKYSNDMTEAMKQCMKNLEILENLIAEYPATDAKREMSRFGNLAFRDWFDRMLKESDEMQKEVLKVADIPDRHESWKYKELSAYWRESFGNRTRIDYGTGHELSFAGFMFCLAKLGIVNTESDCMCLVGMLFPRYLKLMRNLQLTYKLEPAGSHGVWGLDDYQFLPFYFGSAQLEQNVDGIVPSGIHNERILKDYSDDYLYIAAIQFIHQVKRGPFAEHSPILNNISGVANWKKISGGMLKMYHAEVLDKFVVVQHFLFGKLLPFESSEQEQSNNDEQDQQQQQQ